MWSNLANAFASRSMLHKRSMNATAGPTSRSQGRCELRLHEAFRKYEWISDVKGSAAKSRRLVCSREAAGKYCGAMASTYLCDQPRAGPVQRRRDPRKVILCSRVPRYSVLDALCVVRSILVAA